MAQPGLASLPMVAIESCSVTAAVVPSPSLSPPPPPLSPPSLPPYQGFPSQQQQQQYREHEEENNNKNGSLSTDPCLEVAADFLDPPLDHPSSLLPRFPEGGGGGGGTQPPEEEEEEEPEQEEEEREDSDIVLEDEEREEADPPSLAGAISAGEREQQQASLSRVFSLNARAQEFIPKAISIANPNCANPNFANPNCVNPNFANPNFANPNFANLNSHFPLIPEQLAIPPVSSSLDGPGHMLAHLQVPMVPVLYMEQQPFPAQSNHGSSLPPDAPSHPAPPPKPVLTEELKAKIIRQAEFYFSDSNLAKDKYIMKFVKKDAEGFVPLSVVASFRKMKNLTKHHALITSALRHSTQLLVTDDGKKIRRVHPLLDAQIDEIQSRTVVAENLPDNHSVPAMEKFFGTVGNVKLIRICQPEGANGANQLAAKYLKTDMLVSNKLHALVEYETVEQAEKAVSELSDERNWRSGLRVRLLLRRTYHGKHGHQQHAHQQTSGFKGQKSSNTGSDGENDAGVSADGNSDRNGEEVSHNNEKVDDSVGNSNEGRGRGRGGRGGGGGGRGRGGGGHGRGQQHHHNSGRNHHHHPHPPPVGTPPSSHAPNITEMKPPPGPRMPDGTRGFAVGRGKPITNP